MNIETLRALFKYEDGKLVRLQTVNYNAKAGDVAGCLDTSNGYLRLNFEGRTHYAHRLVWALCHGALPVGMIDHIDGDRCNNRIENLRDCTNSANMQNLKGARRDSKTQVLGVSACKDTGKYVARIRHPDGPYVSLGRFECIDEAKAAYLSAKREIHQGCTI